MRSSGDEIKFEPRSAAVDRKHRIIEPFLVVLMYFGLVPARNSKGEIVKFNDKSNTPENQMEEKKEEPKEQKRGLFGWGRRK